MNKFFMLVGLPGCGKSTWAKENKGHYQMFDEVFSSDEYRAKLLGNENDQSNNQLVFKTLYTDLISALKDGKSVCLDATNLTRKDRHNALNILDMNHICCEKIAVMFAVEESIIRRQNNSRERKVPNEVIDKMFRRFELPFLGEGFDSINYVYRRENPLIDFNTVLKKMDGFDQKTPYHSFDLKTHCDKCYFNILMDRELSQNVNLLTASHIHDLGKLYTQEYDAEKDCCHYIGHESYGAYKSLFIDYGIHSVANSYDVAFYINYHMLPLRLADAKPSTIKKYKEQFGEEWDNLVALSNADKKSC